MDNCILNNNYASDNGGGIACVKFTGELSNIILNNNSAKYGGGLYIGDMSVNFTNISITNNSAQEGGGIYTIGVSILDNFNINHNIALNNGDIFYRILISMNYWSD